MKPFPLTYRLAGYLSIALTLCHPSMQVSAATPTPLSQEIVSSEQSSEEFSGVLENGLTYSIAPSPTGKNDFWVKLAHMKADDKEQHAVAQLTQQALFYGTAEHTREDIASTLNALGLDVEADSYAQSSENEWGIQFSLSDTTPEHVQQVLGLISQLYFSPNLSDEAVELARRHTVENADEASEAEILALQSVTADEVRAFHKEWYTHEKGHLTIVGMKDSQVVVDAMNQLFQSNIRPKPMLEVKKQKIAAPDEILSNLTGSLVNRIDLASDNETRVIDGKIWMKEPNWINKQANGRSLGLTLTILGIGGMILAFPVTAPAAILAGISSTMTGIYFLAAPYLKDPNFVDSARKDDLKYGFAYAYELSRAGITLTPYERRILLLEEMVADPQTLPKLPILILADRYQLTDNVIAEIFTVEEMEVLKRLKRDFVQQRNQYKMLKESLENELISLTQPYALARDGSLALAQDYYNHDYYVVARAKLQEERDQTIGQIEASFEKNLITAQERASLIEEAIDDYEWSISTPEFKAGLAAAEVTLTKNRLEIQATYLYQVEVAKQAINYPQRMVMLEQGVDSLIYYYNNELIRLLRAFPIHMPSLPDYLDLRAL